MTYRIVAGMDGSPHSEAALRWSLDLAEARQGELTAVFSWQVPFVSIPMAFDREKLEQEYKQYLVDVSARWRLLPRCRCTPWSRRATPRSPCSSRPRTPTFWWCATRRCLFRMEVEDLCLLAVAAVG